MKELLEGAKVAPAPGDFVNQHYDTARAVGDQLGVDPKIILGHWALETGWGKSVIPGTNNLGNIKDFSGKSGVKAYDKVEKSNDAYRQYASTDEFASDYAKLLSKRFPGVVGAGSDKDAFIQGLQGGQYKYATGGQFEKSMAAMPDSVGKFLTNTDWKKDPSIIAQKIKDAPSDVKNFVASKMPEVSKFIDTIVSPFISTANAAEEETPVEVLINGKKVKFRNKKEAYAAIQQSKQAGPGAS